MWGACNGTFEFIDFSKTPAYYSVSAGYPKTSHPIRCIVVYIQITPASSACLLHTIIIVYDTAEGVYEMLYHHYEYAIRVTCVA